MAENFFLDESAFDAFAKDMATTGTGLSTAHGQLNSILLAYQGCWGDDDIGKAFENNYWDNAEKIRVGTEDAGDGIVETSKKARKSARNLASVDEETAKVLDSQVETE